MAKTVVFPVIEGEKLYTCNGVLEINGPPARMLDQLLKSMDGDGVYSQGVWNIWAAGPATPETDVIDESWLNGGISFKRGSNKNEKINTVGGTYVNPLDYWAATGFPTVAIPDYIAEDQEELTADLTLNFCTSGFQAQRMARLAIERSRSGMVVNYPCNLKALQVKVNEVRKVSNSLLGWDQKLFRVLDWQFTIAGGVLLTLGEENPDMYDIPGSSLQPLPTPDPTTLPDPWTVTPPSSLTLTPRIYDYNSGTATRVDLDLSWTAGGPGQLQYELQYRIVGDTWSGIILVGADTLYTLPTLAAGNYEVRLRGVNSIGAQSVWVQAERAVPLPDTTVPNVSGLEIVGQGNNYQFVGRDITLGWNYVSPREDTDVSGPGRGSSWFRYYVVEVYTTGDVLRRTDYTTHERYTYTYEMNRQDGAGTAIRNVKFSVRIMSAWGALSATPAVITVSNPNIAKLGALALVGGINTLSVGLPQVTEPDFSGYDVHASQTPGFTPGAGNKINSGGPETVVTKINMAPGTWYVRAAGRDSFGSDGANFSDEYSVAVSSLTVTPAMLDGAARTDFFVRDTILYFDAAVLTWDAGYIDRGEHTYTLVAGTLAAANASYIIATFNDSGYTATLSKTAVTSGLPTLTANQSIIAVTSADATPQGNYYCYVRQANSVSIEGALIRNATVETLTIAGNAVTVETISSASNIAVTSTETTIVQTTLDFGDITPQSVVFTITLYTDIGGSGSFNLKLYRGATLLHDRFLQVINPDGFNATVVLEEPTPASGSTTYYLKMVSANGVYISNVAMLARGAKR